MEVIIIFLLSLFTSILIWIFILRKGNKISEQMQRVIFIFQIIIYTPFFLFTFIALVFGGLDATCNILDFVCMIRKLEWFLEYAFLILLNLLFILPIVTNMNKMNKNENK